jgi:hypothetical protein
MGPIRVRLTLIAAGLRITAPIHHYLEQRRTTPRIASLFSRMRAFLRMAVQLRMRLAPASIFSKLVSRSSAPPSNYLSIENELV